MKISTFVSIPVLFSFVAAAPQGSSVCGQVPQNPAADQIGAQYLQIPDCDNGSGGGSKSEAANGNGPNPSKTPNTTSAPASIASEIPQQPSSIAMPQGSGGGKCPAGFRNTVFNTGAPRNAGWPQTTWDSLTANGVSDWIGFALSTLDVTKTYNTDSGPAATTPSLDAAQIHQVMDPTEVSAALDLLKTNPPLYLTLFNEPDYSYDNATPLTSATDAANDLQPLFAAAHPNTTYLSPALANANSDWLTTFRDACGGCMSQIPIITMHLYNPDTNAALGLIEQLHQTWPDKRIWITELAPGAGDGCSLDSDGIVNWLNTLIPQIVKLGYVDRIFWNCGEASTAETCKTDLTNQDGSPTAVLKAYSAIC